MIRRRKRCAEPAPQRRQLLLEHPSICEFEEAQTRVGGAGDHRSERRVDPRQADAFGVR